MVCLPFDGPLFLTIRVFNIKPYLSASLTRTSEMSGQRVPRYHPQSTFPTNTEPQHNLEQLPCHQRGSCSSSLVGRLFIFAALRRRPIPFHIHHGFCAESTSYRAGKPGNVCVFVFVGLIVVPSVRVGDGVHRRFSIWRRSSFDHGLQVD